MASNGDVKKALCPTSYGDDSSSDLIIISSDSCSFHVHEKRLLASSTNNFNAFLPLRRKEELLGGTIHLAIISSALDIMLHCVYDSPYTHILPSLEDVESAIGTFKVYGLSYEAFMAPSKILFKIIYSYVPTTPLKVYAFAASLNNNDLAAIASSHLLNISLPELSDEVVMKMGPIYLKRLILMHLGRMDALKSLLVVPPEYHAERKDCKVANQRALTRTWALESARLIRDGHPGATASSIEAVLLPIGKNVYCHLCKKALECRVVELVHQWSEVESTI